MKKSLVNKVAESGMGHLAILMWIKMHNNQNTFACLEFLIFGQKIFLIFFFEKTKFLKAPVGFELLTYIFATYALIYWGTLLGKMHVKEKNI